MSKIQNRLIAKERTQVTMLLASMTDEVGTKTFQELYVIVCDRLGRNIAEASLKGLLKDMGLTYKTITSTRKQAAGPRGTLQRDTLRAVCAWVLSQEPTLPENSLIRRFTK